MPGLSILKVGFYGFCAVRFTVAAQQLFTSQLLLQSITGLANELQRAGYFVLLMSLSDVFPSIEIQGVWAVGEGGGDWWNQTGEETCWENGADVPQEGWSHKGNCLCMF